MHSPANKKLKKIILEEYRRLLNEGAVPLPFYSLPKPKPGDDAYLKYMQWIDAFEDDKIDLEEFKANAQAIIDGMSPEALLNFQNHAAEALEDFSGPDLESYKNPVTNIFTGKVSTMKDIRDRRRTHFTTAFNAADKRYMQISGEKEQKLPTEIPASDNWWQYMPKYQGKDPKTGKDVYRMGNTKGRQRVFPDVIKEEYDKLLREHEISEEHIRKAMWSRLAGIDI